MNEYALIDSLPEDAAEATLVGRVWRADIGGPSPVILRNGRLIDVSCLAPTVSALLELEQPVEQLAAFDGEDIGGIADVARFAGEGVNLGRSAGSPPALLAPVDLQCIKACGVTFAISALERVIEERARGDFAAAASFRSEIADAVGMEMTAVTPGSAEAKVLKRALIARGLWSQYLEVAIGPDAEIFTKAPLLSAIGWGAQIGVRSDSIWNNPEPEIVLICNSRGKAVGAALGNDVNLRDFEGRSALLLGKAKDNNAACAIGPFIRLFDARFSVDDVRSADVSLEIRGEDGFDLSDSMTMTAIARDPLELVRQTCGVHHQYPDGFVLFLGTLFAPIVDREVAGMGFTHRQGDRVMVRSPRIGTLVNEVTSCGAAPPWTYGVSKLMHNLAQRGLL